MFVLATSLLTGSFIFNTSADTTSTNSNLQSQIDSDNQQIQLLTQKIAEYQAKLNQIGADKKTLQDAINSLDLQRSKIQTQVAVTQHQIDSTQLQLQQLGGQIDDTQQNISQDQAALMSYLQTIQQNDDEPLLAKLLSSGDISSFWNDLDATLQVQDSVRQRTESLKTQEQNLESTQNAVQEKKNQLSSQKQSLSSQQQSLTATVNSKNQLLKETNNQETTYQRLLAAAQQELESYTAFTQNAGGAGLIGSQTVCDAWGCYYNQRDSAWGSLSLNGTRFTLASDGCLITAMAMVMTHYGYKNVTPVTINSNPANFASYYPAFLLDTIYAGGVSASRIGTAIDSILASGDPVIVGLKAYGGTHFVVLVSGSHGSYTMRDPYISGGKDISFNAHYSVRSIYKISKVVING